MKTNRKQRRILEATFTKRMTAHEESLRKQSCGPFQCGKCQLTCTLEHVWPYPNMSVVGNQVTLGQSRIIQVAHVKPFCEDFERWTPSRGFSKAVLVNRIAVTNTRTDVPCCPTGRRYEIETGANANDHPGDCYPDAIEKYKNTSNYGKPNTTHRPQNPFIITDENVACDERVSSGPYTGYVCCATGPHEKHFITFGDGRKIEFTV